MDGTIINSGTILANTINHVRISCNLEKMNDEILLNNINNPDINPSKFFYDCETFDKKHSVLFEDYYLKNFTKFITLYDGISNLLQKLKKCEYTISIATNASNNFASLATKHLNINDHFSYIIGRDDVKNPKPKPDMLLKTMYDLNFSEDNSILIGDSFKDLYAAKSANIECKLVNWGFTMHSENGYNNTDELYNSINP